MYRYNTQRHTVYTFTVNDDQGFKDTSGVYYRFTPDDGHDGESSAKAKQDLNYRTTFSCANIEVSVCVCVCVCVHAHT